MATFTRLVIEVWATYGLFYAGTAFLLMPPGDWGHFSADLILGITWATVAAGGALYAGYLVALPFRRRI
jgi:hypothetical protein